MGDDLKSIVGLRREFSKLKALLPKMREEAAKIPDGPEMLQSALDKIGPAKDILLEFLEKTPRELKATLAETVEKVEQLKARAEALKAKAPPPPPPVEEPPPIGEPDPTLAPIIGRQLIEKYGLADHVRAAKTVAGEFSTVEDWAMEAPPAAALPEDLTQSVAPKPTRDFSDLDHWLADDSSVTSTVQPSQSVAGVSISNTSQFTNHEFGAEERSDVWNWISGDTPTIDVGGVDGPAVGTESSVSIASAGAFSDAEQAKRRFLQWRTKQQNPLSDS